MPDGAESIGMKNLKFQLPPGDLLTAMGAAIARQAHLDHMLRMTTKTIRGVSVPIGLRAVPKKTSSMWLRRSVQRLAKKRLGDGAALKQLMDLLERCELATEKRNRFAHAMFAGMVDESNASLMLNNDDKWVPLPAVAAVYALADELEALAFEVNHARLQGFLAQALKARAAESTVERSDGKDH
jgi:hypothetical protein